jgi:NAD(P)H-quinone oxidoreductase subunit 2
MVRALVGLSTMTRVWATSRRDSGSFFIASPASLGYRSAPVRGRRSGRAGASDGRYSRGTDLWSAVGEAILAAVTGAGSPAAAGLASPASVATEAIASGVGTGGLNLQLNAAAIAPELAVLAALVACLLVDLAGERTASRWVPPICYGGLGGALVLLALQWDAPLQTSFLGSFLPDNLAIAFRSVVAASTLISLLLSWRYVERSGTPVGEYAAILLAATLGAMFLCGATDLVSIFISLETLSVSSYLLAGYMKRDARSSEAALKYLLVGSAAAAVFLYGASLLYGLSGGTSLDAIALALSSAASPVTALALVFVLATVAFKIAAVPFHQWTPDVYEGSPTPVVAFLSVGSKAAGFALALRILVGCFESFDAQWKFLFTVLAVLSMVLGNVVALAQTSMKRMLAYSSIGQAGFVMIGLVCGTEDGFAAMVLYMAAYLFMNLGAFACIILFSLRTGSDRIADYAGLYQKDPLITLGLSLCLLSLGGIPPMLGFFGKIYLFFAGWADHQYLLVVVGLVTSVVSIYYYISVIKMMVVKEPQEASDAVKAYPPISWDLAGMQPLRAGLVGCVLVTAIGGILSSPLFDWASGAVTGTPILQQAIASADAAASALG